MKNFFRQRLRLWILLTTVLKITEVMKNSGLSTGLFRDNARRKDKHKRKTKLCVWVTSECEKKRKAFFKAKNHMRLKNAHTTEIRAQTSREYKKEVNSIGNIRLS